MFLFVNYSSGVSVSSLLSVSGITGCCSPLLSGTSGLVCSPLLSGFSVSPSPLSGISGWSGSVSPPPGTSISVKTKSTSTSSPFSWQIILISDF